MYSCLRYYLYLDSDLRSLLDAWGIGVTGPEAYRRGSVRMNGSLGAVIYVFTQVLLETAVIGVHLGLDQYFSDGSSLCPYRCRNLSVPSPLAGSHCAATRVPAEHQIPAHWQLPGGPVVVKVHLAR